MTYSDDLFDDDQVDDITMALPDRGGAEFGDEGSGATSGYGDLTEDDLIEDDDLVGDDVLETDPDDDLISDDLDEDDDI